MDLGCEDSLVYMMSSRLSRDAEWDTETLHFFSLDLSGVCIQTQMCSCECVHMCVRHMCVFLYVWII